MFFHETMNISIVNAIYVLMRIQLGHCLFKSIRKNQICVNEIDIINLYMAVVSLECFLLLLYGHRCTGCWLCIVYIGCVDVDTLSHFNWCSSVMNYVCPRYLSCLYVCFSPFYGVCLWDDNEAWPSTEKGDKLRPYSFFNCIEYNILVIFSVQIVLWYIVYLWQGGSCYF